MKFYRQNAKTYFEETSGIDPSSFLEPLCLQLSPGATIFDLGCGSGRDMKWFAEQGFEVMGMEQSPELAELAEEYSGRRVIVKDFTEYNFDSVKYDAVVLVGALVHIGRKRIQRVLENIIRTVNLDGYLLVTMKQGDGIKMHADGRKFVLWQKEELENIFENMNLKVLRLDIQTSKLRPDDVWMGYVLQKG